MSDKDVKKFIKYLQKRLKDLKSFKKGKSKLSAVLAHLNPEVTFIIRG